MGSSGGGKTTTTTNSDPWKPQQPYLQNIFGQAQNLYNQSQAQTGQTAPLYQQYLQAAQAAGTGALPQEGQMNATWNQGMQAAQVLQPRADAIAQAAYDYNADDLIRQQMAAGRQTNAAIPSLQQFAGDNWADPYAAAAFNTAGTSNPYIAGGANLAAMALANPALAGLANTASGNYLTPDTNPYLQQSVQNALDQANATIASQFNQGGRYGSGMMAGTQARELGKIATGAYANAYEAERARQEAANQALGQQFLSGVGQAAQGQQQAGALTQGQMGQAIAGINAAGNLLGNQQQLQQEAAKAGGQLSAADLDRQLQAQQTATNAYLQEIQNRISAQQAAGQLQLGGLQTANQALNFAPQLQAMDEQQIAQLANAAQVQQQLMNMPEEERWKNLANYLAMIQGNYGGTSAATAPGAGGPSIAGQVAGGLMGAAGLASMFSSRELKNEHRRPDPSAVADGVLGLPVTTWSYRGDDEIHIGPYAEDFRDAFGVGDGVTIKYADMFGVLFATVQHLLAKNAEQATIIDDLASRIEDLEDAV